MEARTEMGVPRDLRGINFDGSIAPIALAFLNWLILLGVVSLSIWAVQLPEPVPASAAADVFSAERAMQHLRVIARSPHPIGTTPNGEVRQYLLGRLSSLGLQTELQSGTGFSGFHDWLGGISAANVHNVLGRLPGTANTGGVLLVAHYDSHEQGPGAADDGASVAAILEAVRTVKAQSVLRNDLIVLFTDGEEQGLLGADLFVSSHPWVKDIGVALNFDNAGDSGPCMMLETSNGNRWLVEQFAAAAPHPFASAFFYSVVSMLGGAPTDMRDLKSAGLRGLNFGIIANRGNVNHTRLDDVDNLSLASLQHEGSYALALTRYFGGLDLSRAPLRSSGDEVFFDWIGTRLVHYPESWVLPMHFILTIALVLLILGAAQRRQVQAHAVTKVALACLAVMIAIPASLAAIRWLFDQTFEKRLLVGDALSNRVLFVSQIVLALASAMWIVGHLRSKVGLLDLSATGLLLTWILTTALAIKLPTASYLLFWPLFFATASFALLALKEKSPAIPLLAAVPTLLLFGPVIHLFGELAGQSGTTAPVAIGFMVTVLAFLLAPFTEGLAPDSSARRGVLAALLAATVVLGTWGVLLSRFSPQHPKPDTILYSLNADDHRAVWISFDDSIDEWTRQFLTDHPRRGNIQEYQAGLQDDLWNSAPPADFPPPEVEVLGSQFESGLHELRLRLRSPRHANGAALTLGRGTELIAVTIGGRNPFSDLLRGKPGIPRQIGIIPFSGLPDEGVEIILKLKCTNQCNIGAYDRSFGLPSLPGFSFRSRPAEKMGWYGSDVTLVGREYKF